jgi:sugar lactone lactonase YvrE
MPSVRPLLLAAAASLAFSAAAAAQPVNNTPSTADVSKQRVFANIGLTNSECIRYDEANDRYLISNLNTRGPENNGYITIMSPDGVVTNQKFIEGGKNGVTLIDPLGIYIRNGIIWVADITHMRKFDLKTGKPLGEVALPGANRPNDIYVTADNTAYISDNGGASGTIIKVSPAGQVSLLQPRDDIMEKPNGVAVMPDGSVVHGGRGVNITFRDANTGALIREKTLPTGQFDALIPLPDGSILAASQLGKNVYKVSPNGDIVEVAKEIAVPAAIGWDSKRNRLLIPQIAPGTITMVDLQ